MSPIGNGMQEEIRQSVLVVEPNEAIRTGLSFMARSIPFVTSVTSCADLDLATDMITNGAITAMLISARFGALPTEALREGAIRQHVKYLVTMQENGQSPNHDALDMVTNGVVLLDTLTTGSLADVLRRLAMDQTVLPVNLLRSVLRSSAARSRPGPYSLPALTPRELQVLSFLADGLSNKQIARRISISEHGVKRHVANVLAKLNCPNRTQAVSYALQVGMLAPISQRESTGSGRR